MCLQPAYLSVLPSIYFMPYNLANGLMGENGLIFMLAQRHMQVCALLEGS